MDPLRRLPPLPRLRGTPEDYQSYRIHSPQDVEVVAACEQVGCPHWANGWESHIDEATQLGMAQAAYIRQRSGRTFTEARTAEGVTVFRFEPHQRCFAEHHTRPELYLVRSGVGHVSGGLIRHHQRAVDWVEDCAEHQDHLKTLIDKG
jgi:hypothetical protein